MQVINLQTILINVENILTDYVSRAIDFWQQKANLINRELPEDFMDSFLSAGNEAREHHFYRFPHFQAFEFESRNLFNQVNQQIHDDNPTLINIRELIKKHNLQVGLIYDQKQKQAQPVSEYLEKKLKPIVQLYFDDAFLGKPEANILSKAKALCSLKANDTLVLDASKNGILSAYLANMKGIYLDQGAGVSERTFKYSYRNISSFDELHKILEEENNTYTHTY